MPKVVIRRLVQSCTIQWEGKNRVNYTHNLYLHCAEQAADNFHNKRVREMHMLFAIFSQKIR